LHRFIRQIFKNMKARNLQYENMSDEDKRAYGQKIFLRLQQ
jgi:hypothetical protein